MLVAAIASSACSEGTAEVVRTGPVDDQSDAGTDTQVVEPDTSVVTGPAPVEGSHLCAAAGRSSGAGYAVVHCTAPTTVHAPTLTGGGYMVEQGALKPLLPRPEQDQP